MSSKEPQAPPLSHKGSVAISIKTVPSQGSASNREREKDVSPEMMKLQKLFEKFYGTGHTTSTWEKSKRKLLRSLTLQTFVGAVTSGVTLYILITIWFMLFTNAKVIYTFPTNYSTSGAPQTIDVKSPFLTEIKYAMDAFTYYSNGIVLLIIGGLCGFYTLRAPYQSRLFRYFVGSLIFLLAALAIIVGPFFGLTARNSETEVKLLDNDANYAYDQSIKGSIKYFENRQCDGIEKAVMGRDPKEADEMRAFCRLLSRLVFIYYFMGVTVILPVLGIIVCWLQIIINRKVWNMKAVRRPKERTDKQKQADRCQKD